MSKKKKTTRAQANKGWKKFSGYNPPKSGQQRPKPSAKPPAKPSQSQKSK